MLSFLKFFVANYTIGSSYVKLTMVNNISTRIFLDGIGF